MIYSCQSVKYLGVVYLVRLQRPSPNSDWYIEEVSPEIVDDDDLEGTVQAIAIEQAKETV